MAKSSRREAANPIEVIEAAYDLGASPHDWLASITRAIRPLLEGGRGVSAYTFDMAKPMKAWLQNEVVVDLPPGYLALQRAFQLSAPGTAEAMHVIPEPLDGLVEATRKAGFGNILEDPVLVGHFREMNVRDYVAFLTIEPGGRGICINAGQVEERTFDLRTRHVWSRVSAHVAAARRLREALVAADAAPVEAMLTPSGKLEHAEGDGKTTTARAVLREAVRQQERARGRMRRDDPAQATEAWKALVSGRWSLVDHYERGGRRYIAARRNDHTLPDPRALTPRERVVVQLAALGKSNKLIAYEIGLSASTVATHISAAMRKLRVKSRVELIELARQLGGA
ncbi:MAG: hypothetical protein JWP01_4227 [Myxococcales bacterium]|nr:hypothetical protein [Myxococcales bacterium]